MDVKKKLRENRGVLCVVGLGYVGLPLALEFEKAGLKVIGFDVNEDRIKNLIKGMDDSGDVGRDVLLKSAITFTSDPAKIRKADFIIIVVPTPINSSKIPELSYVVRASSIVGRHLKKGSVIVFESTVYPGVTEEICLPILEEESKIKCRTDFKLGYSPERMNPGDKEHTIDKIVKVVAGIDKETTEILAELYAKITTVFKARDIKTAEAAKVIENIQRDLNIALMNELSMIFRRMGLNTRDVLEAAFTKWNFNKYFPGLVGGHCIPVDPYYLTYKAQEHGYHPRIILAGRKVNDSMPKHVAELTLEALGDVGKAPESSRVLVMGLAFKENVKDMRNSPSKILINELREYGIEVICHDPLLNPEQIRKELDIELANSLTTVKSIDAAILVTPHDIFKELSLDELKKCMNAKPILIDLRWIFDPEDAKENGFLYKEL